MKYYNFTKAKEIIEKHSSELKEVLLGMEEDWFWTGETVWKDGVYTQELSDETEIAGINGSTWATPIIRLCFIDGEVEDLNCFEIRK